MKVQANQNLPAFTIKDVYGNVIDSNSFAGQKVHLNFYRFSGCPFCNLRFHSIAKLTEEYKKNNVKLISIFESSVENMRDQIAGESFYSIMIPDSESRLYKQFEIDRSTSGFLKYLLFKGGLGDVMKGNKLFKQKVKIDGHANRMPAEFLIDKSGKVVTAHYATDGGDFLPINTIKEFINS